MLKANKVLDMININALFVVWGSLFVSVLFSCGNPKPAEISQVESAKAKGNISGVWIATPFHNEMLHAEDKMIKALDELDSMGVNTLFLCTWADNKTIFKSEVLLEKANYPSIDSTSFMAPYNYQGGSGDVVADLIKHAHEREMKVIFWFEFGFMAGWGQEPTVENNPILAKNPHWAARAHDGAFASYNKADFYFNSYDPEVQQFILDLIEESLEKYPQVDGIQGDDRLPAAPRDSGYDSITVARFAKEHNGMTPPDDFQDSTWVQWRLDILNQFAVRLHALVKSKGEYIMAFSPNPYPWCVENLMQDWPQWIEDDLVELLSVQCYRTSYSDYKKTVDEAWSYAASNLPKEKFVPGVILGIGAGKMMKSSSLDSILRYNREQGFAGESYFYVKWLVEDDEFDAVVSGHQFNLE